MGRVVIKKDRCKGCELCVAACPKGLLEIVDYPEGKNGMTVELKDERTCIGCAFCAKSCPDYAIVEVYK